MPRSTDPTQSLKDALDAIDLMWADGRYATSGGTGIYSGGEYDNFRRSSDIEDRRKQNYNANPIPMTNETFWNVYSEYNAALIASTTPLSRDLGINDINSDAVVLGGNR